MKLIYIFAMLTDGSNLLRRASGKVAQSKVGHFLCSYFKILAVAYLRKIITSPSGYVPSVSSVNGDRFFVAYNYLKIAYRW